MGPMYGFVVLLHVLGAFTFVAADGVSMVAAVRLRGERDRVRQVALLDVSAAGVGLMYVGLLVLLAAGIVAGFMGNHWGRAWIWAALVTLVVVIVVMYAVATPFYGRMRRRRYRPMGRAPRPVQAACHRGRSRPSRNLERASRAGDGRRHRPGLIIWLMLLKPF